MESVLVTRKLTKIYGGKKAVNEVNMDIKKGDIYGFIGKNGAGKTTTMKMVLGMIFPNGGEVELFGEKANGKARRRIGSLIEAPGLYKNCTAYDNLRRFAMLFGGNDKEIKDLLEIVNLTNTGKKKAGAFSLGMKQRLGIAIAMLGNPEFLVLDEPVNGLDPAGIKEIRDTILNINREKGVTLFISSHLLGELAKISTRYGIINNGVLVAEKTIQEIEAECGSSLNIKCAYPQKAKEVLKDRFNVTDISETTTTLTIKVDSEHAAEMNAALVGAGCGVYDFHTVSSDIEDYFLERLG